MNGDAKARDWIARYLLGLPGELLTLGAVAEAVEAEAELVREEARE
jgi:hypothetical protein